MKLIGNKRPLGTSGYLRVPSKRSLDVGGFREYDIKRYFERLSIPLFNQYLGIADAGIESIWNTLKGLQ